MCMHGCCTDTESRQPSIPTQVITDELHPRNQLNMPSYTALDAQEESEEYLYLAHDELDANETHSDITADRHNEGLLTAADENAVSSMVKEELTPITHTEVVLSPADSGSEGMLSAKSSFTAYVAAEEDIQKAQSTASRKKHRLDA